VYVVDSIAHAVISIGGLAAIAAILGIVVQLVSVSGALFFPGEIGVRSSAEVPALADAVLVRFDEHRSSALAVDHAGAVRMVSLTTGEAVSQTALELGGALITASAWSPKTTQVALGLSDGRYVVGDLGFTMRYLEPDADETGIGGVVSTTPIGQRRATLASAVFAAPKSIRQGEGPVVLIDHAQTPQGEVVVTLRQDGGCALHTIKRTTPLDGSAPKIRATSHGVPFEPPPGVSGEPRWLFITDNGFSAIFLWADGWCRRYDIRDPGAIAIAETLRVVPEGRRITAAALLIGDRTIVIGDDHGGVSGWFAARTNSFETPDGSVLVRAHELRSGGPAVRLLAVSPRDRQVAIADESGDITVRHMTSGAFVARAHTADHPVRFDGALRISPKGDFVAGVDADGTMLLCELKAAYPEASIRGLFGPVWYEGEPAPSFVYQSSSGDDASEPKLSLVPLLTGTLKATVYTMLIAAPIAIFAALCSAEFLSRRQRSVIKPGIEMMASLPSVVLGFVAAMVLAPMIGEALPGVLLLFGGVPLAVLLGAHLWRYVPVRLDARTSEAKRLLIVSVIAAVSFAASLAAGPVFESLLFRPTGNDMLVLSGSYEPLPRARWPEWIGRRTVLSADDGRRLRAVGLAYRDGEVVRPIGSVSDPAIASIIRDRELDRASLRAWLDGFIGGPWPGWFLIGIPAAAILVAFGRGRLSAYTTFGRANATSGMVMFAASIAAMFVIAGVGAWAISALGFDARDSILGPFQQRNSLVVGIAMAVAVIPIIYTIADDSMTSVPDSLRSASMGAGASKWQTAVRVVLPAAGSGVFSALMIGLGRAVGETMIVLMATGNTPIMDFNMFEGFRTLAANIAVELPEAPRGAAHYRVLFLCGICLLAMTLVVNTLAEVVRQRFRKRSAGL
jgi:phosphate transport system permease protein